jgi:DNA processing protein
MADGDGEVAGGAVRSDGESVVGGAVRGGRGSAAGVGAMADGDGEVAGGVVGGGRGSVGGGAAAVALPVEAYAAVLAALPGMGPARLTAVLGVDDAPAAWARVVSGRGWAAPAVREVLGGGADRLVDRWRRAALDVDPAAVWRRIVEAGVGVSVIGSVTYPAALASDPEPPSVLFHLGSPAVLAGPRVAIVGTRRCSATGRSVAVELGRDLAEAGVAVVSGLASGIDAAAHHGALAATDGASPIGVAGSGLDVVYPAGQGDLWQAVIGAGVLLSEAPLGVRPERWRFPARNRIIAGLAEVVVVVESHRRGGSLHTVDEAERRGIDVMAVPGSVRNPAAAGSNALLASGCAPVMCADDVLVAVGLGGTGPPGRDAADGGAGAAADREGGRRRRSATAPAVRRASRVTRSAGRSGGERSASGRGAGSVDGAASGPVDDDAAPGAAPVDAAPVDAAPVDAAPVDAASVDAAVLDAAGWEAATLDEIVLRSGRDVGTVALALHRLVEAGAIARRGGWYERLRGGAE